MSLLNNLYEINEYFKENNNSESSNDGSTDKIKELEEKIESIKKKETRGFITKDEADEELSDVAKKLKEIKEKIDKKDEN